ncbi:hypothetical protein SAMN05444401_0117 [Clostridium amylolyticum]|uniref:Beta/Gamma crystallin n=1 Tax=Clostridium amylolyticum TaxID=1121298 RepID=A0A1M6N6T7_9CLOT|nr:hypothetical protein [Clostridium amylolyticum]SHJ91411.1 hypothetical protein SAMN05444401_0117 [Clostridium amylolyticum]
MKKFKLLSFTLALGLLCFSPLAAKAAFTDYGVKKTFTKNGIYVLGYTGSNDGYASVVIQGIRGGIFYRLAEDSDSSWAQTDTIYIRSSDYAMAQSQHNCRNNMVRIDLEIR